MKKYFTFLIFLFLYNFSYGQNDSEIIEIKNFYKTGLDFITDKKYDEALRFINIGIEKSEKIKNESLLGNGYFYLSKYYSKKKEYYHAIENLKKALFFFVTLNNEEEIYKANFKLGRLYNSISEFDKSLVCYFRSLKIAEQIKNEIQIAVNLEKIGEVYLITSDLEKARINFYSAIEIYKRLKNDKGIIANLTNLGATYQKEGARTNNKDLIIKAIGFYKEGLEKTEKGDFERNRSIILGNIGSSFRSLKKYDESLAYLFRGLNLKLELKNYASAAHSCNDISETYLEMNILSRAREYAFKAIEYSKDLNIHKERFACYLLSKIEYESGNYKNAHIYLKRYHKIQDSLFSMQKITIINGLRIKYETEKKQLKIEAQKSNIALLDAKNKLKNQWLLFGGLGLLSIFILITLQKSKNRIKQDKVQQEKFSQQLLLSQEEERTRISRELHDSVGQQLTLIKRKAQNLDEEDIAKMTNTALEEVRSISRNLYPTLLKQLGLTESIMQLINEFDEQTNLFFTMEIDFIDAYFKENTSLNFYRLIQECLTNIVKHASAKSVIVTIKKEDNAIITFISDNGKGFDVTDNKKKNSLGLKTIFERIKIMNGKLSIDSKLNNGTNFIFSIPVKNE